MVTWQGNVPNSADFMASNKIYAVFHVFGCFKFKVTFHDVFSFKWVLISILIWNGFVEYQNRKKSTIIFGNLTEHAELGLVKNCLISIIRWLANVAILLFNRTFEVFLVKQKVYSTILLFSETLRAMCSFSTAENKWYKVNYLGNNGKRAIFFKTLIIISRINKN